MPQAVYLNVLIFPEALEFKNAALGLRRLVKLPGLSGYITLPRSNLPAIGKPFADLLPPRVANVDYAARVHQHVHKGYTNDVLRWGKYFTWNGNDPGNTAKAAVCAATLTFSPLQDGRQHTVAQLAEECLAAFPEWCSRLIDWIEVITQDDLNAAHPLRSVLDPDRWTSTAWVHDSAGRLDYSFVNPAMTLSGSDGRNAMGAAEWSSAIRAANRRQDIPDVWALLRDARAAQRRGNGRRAVLDAATAAELVVEDVLRARLLRDNAVTCVDKFLKGTWQVSRRTELLASFGMWLPNGLDSKLSQLRNRVVHSNGAVTGAQAKAAVEVTEELVRRYAMTLLDVA